MEREKELETLILNHRDLYYKGYAVISDESYDKLEDELKSLNPNSEVFKKVGTSKLKTKLKHEFPVLSLEKINKEEDLYKWSKNDKLVASYKVDGSNVTLVYVYGQFDRAITRGDGEYGENVTRSITNIKFPKELKYCSDKPLMYINGEVYLKKSKFERLKSEMISLGLEEPSSLRNIVSGLLHRKENQELCSHLSFMAHGIKVKNYVNDYCLEDNIFEELKDYGFDTPYITMCTNFDLTQFEHSIDNEDYLIDGIVFSLNSLREQEERGYTSHHPKGKIAFKFTSEKTITTVKQIEESVTRSGKVSFVGIINPVELSGATISRVTFHNIKYIKTHRLGVGATIEITRSNEVIPKHLKTIKVGEFYEAPKKCPDCGTDLIMSDTLTDLICPNKFSCKPQLVGALIHFAKTIGFKNISDKTIEKIYDENLIETYSDFFKLPEKDLFFDGFGEKSKLRLNESIKNCMRIPYKKFIASLNLNNVGETVGELIEQHIIIDKLPETISYYDLKRIDGLGEIICKEIKDKWDSILKISKDLESVGVTFYDSSAKFEYIHSQQLKLYNKNIVITGTLSKPRKDIEQDIKNEGGVIQSAVNKTTSYLVTNEKSNSSKRKKAEDLNITIITEDELYEIMRAKNEE